MVLLVGWFSWVRLVAVGVWLLPAAGRRLRGRLVRGSSRPALCAVCLLSAAVPARPAARLRGWAGVLGPDGFQGWGALASVGLLRWLGRWFLVWFRFRGVSVLLPCLALLSVVLCCLVSGARGSVLLCGAVSGFSCHACSLTASCHRVTLQLRQVNTAMQFRVLHWDWRESEVSWRTHLGL